MYTPTLFLLAGSLLRLTSAGYVLQDDYDTKSFFNMFDFFTGDDPTHGYVNYIDQNAARDQGLIGERDGATYIGVDSTDVAWGRGRNSVRLSSKQTYTHGLIVLDLQHMPGGQCGSWPAFWTFGPNWPTSGEIDIIEGVNSETSNAMTLHTKSGCSISNTGSFSGQIRTPNCDVNAPGQYTNEGCKIASNDGRSYGRGFNAIGGGVYATDWTSEAISVWFFPRDSIPNDLTTGNPNPATWGRPNAKFEGGCNIDEHFRDHNIIFDITFCGDWAGNVWGQDGQCSGRAPNCQAFVQNNPGEFGDAFWQVNSLKVYSENRVKARSLGPEESTQAVASSEDVKVPGFNSTEVAVSTVQTADFSLTAPPTTLVTASQKSSYQTTGIDDREQASAAQAKRALHKHLVRHQHHKYQ